MSENCPCPLCGSPQASKRHVHPMVMGSIYDCRACGQFLLPHTEELAIESWGDRARLSFIAATRKIRGEPPPVFTWSGIGEMEEGNPWRAYPWIEAEPLCEGQKPGVLDRLDNALINLACQIKTPGQVVEIQGHDDHFCYWAEDWPTLRFLLDALGRKGLVQKASTDHKYSLTVDGWVRADELRHGLGATEGRPRAFVAMWFDKSMEPVYEEAIKPAIKATGYDPVRVDQVEHNQKIDDEIIAGIRSSRFVIADFTHGESGPRGGVYYEAGYAHGLSREVIFTIREEQMGSVHFDTNHFNHIAWKDTEDLRRKLENRILATVGRAPRP